MKKILIIVLAGLLFNTLAVSVMANSPLGNAIDRQMNVGIAGDVKDEFLRIRFVVNTPILEATDPAGDVFFIAPFDCQVTAGKAVWGTKASTDATVKFLYCTGTDPGTSGQTVASLVPNTTADTVTTLTISSSYDTLSAGDRLSVDYDKTATSLANFIATFTIKQLGD